LEIPSLVEVVEVVRLMLMLVIPLGMVVEVKPMQLMVVVGVQLVGGAC
jgi:hypothetical protein